MPADPSLGPDAIDELARQVDDQLNALQAASPLTFGIRGFAKGKPAEIPDAPKQRALIEAKSGEPFESFWQKYLRHARRDLCLPGGMLHEQWKKWQDLRSRDAVKMTLAALAGMGVSAANIPVVAVAAAVFLLNAAAKIGIDAICEGCADASATGDKAG